MKVASYKGTHSGLKGLFNIAVRWWLSGKYSHTELIFSNGLSGSSSFIDGGVRVKRINYDALKWDIAEVPGDELAAMEWFVENAGRKYDVLGLLGFVLRRGTQARNKWFCNEAIGAALGVDEPWRFDPSSFPIVINQRTANATKTAK